MPSLIEYIGLGFFIIGFIATLLLMFVSAWQPHYKKKKLSRQKFIKFAFLISITSVIAGAGGTILFSIDSLSEFSLIRTLIASILCMIIYPVFQVGTYVFNMKRQRYIEYEQHKK